MEDAGAGQRVVAAAMGRQRLLHTVDHIVAGVGHLEAARVLQGPLDPLDDAGRRDRLDEEVVCAGAERPLHRRAGRVGGEHQQGHEGERCHLLHADRAQELVAGHARQAPVGDDQVRRLGQHRLQRVLGRLEAADPAGMQPGQHGAHHHLHRLGILDHDDVEEFGGQTVAAVMDHRPPVPAAERGTGSRRRGGPAFFGAGAGSIGANPPQLSGKALRKPSGGASDLMKRLTQF
ncbi:hypothetical protein A6302_04265 [Methylobrevis pamukkalensis]|uniref:Uncharacterized protein n=1 Tax=Methylobrevis pamukkalensis TaxID=1439726 RepID=A0A1E3GWL5_9HYPH|nr:hypothetical protein A6302_04265 [Methylobrevis pamukkalensis]